MSARAETDERGAPAEGTAAPQRAVLCASADMRGGLVPADDLRGFRDTRRGWALVEEDINFARHPSQSVMRFQGSTLSPMRGWW
jgi:hypothetical protein